MNLHKNLSLRVALKYARDLGCEVEKKDAHGEIRLRDPRGGVSYTVHHNRKDAGKGLLSFLQSVARGEVPSRARRNW